MKQVIQQNQQGITLARQGHNRSALKHFNLAIEKYPNLPLSNSHNPKYSLYSNRGLTKEHLHDFKGALADYNQALSLNPRYAVGYCNRGGAEYNLGHYSKAIADFKRAIKFKNDYEKAYFFLGSAEMKAGKNHSATRAFNHLIKLNSKIFLPFFERGCAELADQEYQAAISDFKRANHLNLNNGASKVAILNNLGMAENNVHQYSQAIPVLKQALKLIPNNQYALTNLKIAQRGRKQERKR